VVGGRYSLMVPVVVLDTNSMPHAQFSRSALERLRQLAGEDAAIVVPEVVLWEWAEHAHSENVALEEAVKSLRVDQGVIGRPILHPGPSAEEIVSRIESALLGMATVWYPNHETWRAALRDQVLQVGSGETKADVKTGAADAVVLACIKSESELTEGLVIIVSSDKKLLDNARGFDNVRPARGIEALMKAMRSFIPATEDLALRLAENLPTYFNERLMDSGVVLPFGDLGVELEVGGVQLASSDSDRLSSIYISHVDDVEVHDLRVEAEGDRRLALAALRFFGTIAGEIVTYHGSGDGVNGATRQAIDFSSDFLDVTVAVRCTQDWWIEEVVPTGVAILVVAVDEELDGTGVPRFRAEPSS